MEKNDFKLMETMHHLTSGCKAVYTEIGINGVITIRQALGGAAYTNWSAIPSFFDDLSPIVTFEGDNTVMAQ